MHIVDLATLSDEQKRQAAQILVDAFKENWPDAWPSLADALEEIDGMLEEGKVALVALEGEHVLGMIGGMPTYAMVWELHPLGVSPAAQRRGVGASLVRALEHCIRERGGMTMMLGSDDEAGMTSIAGVDVYPDVLKHLSALEDRRGHPFVFYQKMGYSVVGIVPDANGFGKPDILLAKRISIAAEAERDIS